MLIELQNRLTQITIDMSRFDVKRDYIGMSNALLPAAALVDIYTKGQKASIEERLKCYKGYQMEKDLKDRLNQVDFIEISQTKVEVTAFNGIFKGHPDTAIINSNNPVPVDLKSILLDSWLPKSSRDISRKIYFQMQAYMFYMDSPDGLVIYESRENGIIRVFGVKRNDAICGVIHRNYSDVVELLKRHFAVNSETEVAMMMKVAA